MDQNAQEVKEGIQRLARSAGLKNASEETVDMGFELLKVYLRSLITQATVYAKQSGRPNHIQVMDVYFALDKV